MPRIQIDDLGRMIRAKRKEESLSLVDVFDQTGVSPATLSRLERSAEDGTDMPVPSTKTIHALAAWLRVEVVYEREGTPTPPLPDLVAAHLRADRNLQDKDAAFLARLFRTAYNQVATPPAGGEAEVDD